MSHHYHKGRGAQYNLPNRFERVQLSQEEAPPAEPELMEAPDTKYFRDHPKKIVNKVDSPDIGMMYSINPYQGCEHGCIYCYARNSHEYWGYSAGSDFESRIIIKENAPQLLRKFLNDPKWEPYPIAISGNTDCYQPAEKQMELTRQMLSIFNDYKHPVSIITKNALIKRDLDILSELAQENLVKVHVSVTTFNEELRRKMEPRTTTAKKRLEIIETLSNHDIPVGIMLAPVIPGINDHEIPEILKAVGEKGAISAGYTIVRLNGQIGDIFRDWINRNYPDKSDKVLNQIAECHDGKLNDSRWGTRIKGVGNIAKMIQNLFELNKKRFLPENTFEYNLSAFRGPSQNKQLDLFRS